MELKRVEKNVECNYAKRDEIRKKDLKKSVPTKWLKIGLLTAYFATYSSLKEGILKIGVVIGCASVVASDDGSATISDTGEMINTIENFMGIVLALLGIKLFINACNYFLWKKRLGAEDEYIKKEKVILLNTIKVFAIIAVLIFSIDIYTRLNNEKFVRYYYDGQKYTLEEYEKLKKEDEEKKLRDSQKYDLEEIRTLTENYLQLLASKEESIDNFVNELNLVDEVKIDKNTSVIMPETTYGSSIQHTLYKTNIPYDDFKDKMLTYVTEYVFNKDFSTSFTDIEGYLYYEAGIEANKYETEVISVKFYSRVGDEYSYRIERTINYGDEEEPATEFMIVSFIEEDGKLKIKHIIYETTF